MYNAQLLARLSNKSITAYDEVTRSQTKRRNAELHDVILTSVISVIKPRRVRWAGHIVSMGEMRNAYSILME